MRTMKVELRRQNEVIAGNLLDISLNGMCFSTMHEVAKGDEVDLVLSLEDGGDPISIDLEGKVVRVDPDRIAVHFSMNLESFEKLKKSISRAEKRTRMVN